MSKTETPRHTPRRPRASSASLRCVAQPVRGCSTRWPPWTATQQAFQKMIARRVRPRAGVGRRVRATLEEQMFTRAQAGDRHVGAARAGHDHVQRAAVGAGAQARLRRRPQDRHPERESCTSCSAWSREVGEAWTHVAADLLGLAAAVAPPLAQTPRDEHRARGRRRALSLPLAPRAPAGSRCCSCRRSSIAGTCSTSGRAPVSSRRLSAPDSTSGASTGAFPRPKTATSTGKRCSRASGARCGACGARPGARKLGAPRLLHGRHAHRDLRRATRRRDRRARHARRTDRFPARRPAALHGRSELVRCRRDRRRRQRRARRRCRRASSRCGRRSISASFAITTTPAP